MNWINAIKMNAWYQYVSEYTATVRFIKCQKCLLADLLYKTANMYFLNVWLYDCWRIHVWIQFVNRLLYFSFLFFFYWIKIEITHLWSHLWYIKWIHICSKEPFEIKHTLTLTLNKIIQSSEGIFYKKIRLQSPYIIECHFIWLALKHDDLVKESILN